MSRPPSPPFSIPDVSNEVAYTACEREPELEDAQYPKGHALQGTRFSNEIQMRFADLNKTTVSIIPDDELRDIVDGLDSNEEYTFNEEIVKKEIRSRRRAHEDAANNAIISLLKSNHECIPAISALVTRARLMAGDSSAADCALVVFPHIAWSRLPTYFAYHQRQRRSSLRERQKPRGGACTQTGRISRSRKETSQKNKSGTQKRKR